MKSLNVLLSAMAMSFVMVGCGGGSSDVDSSITPATLADIGELPDGFNWQGTTELTLDITASSPRDGVLNVKSSDGMELSNSLIEKGQTISKTFKIASTEDSLEFKLSSATKSVTKIVAISDLLQDPSVVLKLQMVDGYIEPDLASENEGV